MASQKRSGSASWERTGICLYICIATSRPGLSLWGGTELLGAGGPSFMMNSSNKLKNPVLARSDYGWATFSADTGAARSNLGWRIAAFLTTVQTTSSPRDRPHIAHNCTAKFLNLGSKEREQLLVCWNIFSIFLMKTHHWNFIFISNYGAHIIYHKKLIFEILIPMWSSGVNQSV